MRSGAVPLVVFVCLGAGACGGPSASESREAEVRATVVRFLDDVTAGRGARACAALQSEAAEEIRLSALSAIRPPSAPLDERRRAVRRQRDAARTCAGAVRLRVDQLGGQRMRRLRSAAVAAPVQRFAPASTWSVGAQDWLIEEHDGRMTIAAANALNAAG